MVVVVVVVCGGVECGGGSVVVCVSLWVESVVADVSNLSINRWVSVCKTELRPVII